MYGARFSTGFCTRRCYWFPRMVSSTHMRVTNIIPLGCQLLIPLTQRCHHKLCRIPGGVDGWDGRSNTGPISPPYWVDFDLGKPTDVDGFALWSDGEGGWDPTTFALLTSFDASGPWMPVRGAGAFTAKAGVGDIQVFEGFNASSRYWRWNISGTGGNQPWVKEVAFRSGT
jgi:hypothetical protein